MKKFLLIISFLSFACTNTNISKQEDILQIDESQAQNLIRLSIDCVDKNFHIRLGIDSSVKNGLNHIMS